MKSVLEKLQALEKSKLTRLGVKLLLVLIAFGILIWPHLRRQKTLLLSGKEAYFHLKGGPLVIVLSFLNKYTNADMIFLAKFLPIILGMLTVLAFYALLRKLKLSYDVIILSTLILIISPSFIYLFGTLNAYAVMSFILLLALYLFIIKKEFLGVVVIYFLPFFSIPSTFLALLLILIYSLKNQRFRLFLGALPSLVLLYFSPTRILPAYDGRIISDFGGHYGVGMFIVLLSLFGLKYLWKKKYRHISTYVVVLSLCIFSIFDIRILSYLNFILVGLAALGLIDLIKSEWKSDLIKKLSVFIIINGFLFSGLSYINFVSTDLPNKDILEMAEHLKTLPEGNVFSQASREPWIRYAGKSFVTDENLFYTKDIEQALAVIQAKDVKYIWIDQGMKEKIWTGDEEGLQFLLEYSKTFKKNQINDYVTLWEVEEDVISN